jgi:hypothetical protein
LEGNHPVPTKNSSGDSITCIISHKYCSINYRNVYSRKRQRRTHVSTNGRLINIFLNKKKKEKKPRMGGRGVNIMVQGRIYLRPYLENK